MASNIVVVLLAACILYVTFTATSSASVGKKVTDDDEFVVQLANPVGKIRGHTVEGLNGNYYYAFQDVPYAKPPTGEYRFKPPQPLDNWDGIIETTSNTKKCPQNNGEPNQSEDCLILNVYSPVKPGSNASLPVYFWIHGGGFQGGGAELAYFNPQYFISYDIVVVAIQYRVGVLGFLTMNDENISGNIGLKDQQLALKWTSENIHLFGGNSKHIVVGGQSAGSISASYQLLSKANEGLIKAAIHESGTGITPYGFQINYRAQAFEFGRRLNSSMNTNDNKELLEYLLAAPLENILQTQLDWVSSERIGFMIGEFWKPIVEDKNIEGAFLTEPMRQAFENGDFIRVPTLLGFSEEESLMGLKNITEDAYTLAAKLLDTSPGLLINDKLNVPQKDKATAGRELKALYTTDPFLQNKTGFVRFCSDTSFIRSTIRQAEAASPYVPVYLYQFSYSASDVNDIPGAGQAAHGDEIPFFWNPSSDTLYVNETLRTTLLNLWTNFIKEQNPTPSENQDIQGGNWPTTNPDTLQYLNINRTLDVRTHPRQYKEVKDIVEKYLQQPFNVY